MKNRFLIAAALLALSPLAASAQSDPCKAGQACDRAVDGTPLTMEQVLNITAGLRQLGRYETTDKDGKPAVGTYKFSGDLRILIAVNINVGGNVEQAYQLANNELVAQFSGGGGKVPDERAGEYAVEFGKLRTSPCRCSLARIKMNDLKLDDNPIPAPVLGLIIPIIER